MIPPSKNDFKLEDLECTNASLKLENSMLKEKLSESNSQVRKLKRALERELSRVVKLLEEVSVLKEGKPKNTCKCERVLIQVYEDDYDDLKREMSRLKEGYKTIHTGVMGGWDQYDVLREVVDPILLGD